MGQKPKGPQPLSRSEFVYLIAARLGVDMPEVQLDVYNRGMSGHKVSDLKARWEKDAIDLKPDWLSILVGVNA